jgi:peptidyl-prolyl cis-trans isomerase A (cyclophilin A)
VIGRFALSCLLFLAGCGGAEPEAKAPVANAVERATAATAAPEPLADTVRVRLETEAGPIVVALDAKRAPATAANFVRYVREGRFDGTTFYRAARTKGQPGRGFIQGGIRRDYKRMLPPVVHEPTTTTGLRHEPGTISMARAEDGPGATGDFFITLSRQPAMDAAPGKPGYAAFGKVVEGMDVVRRILAGPTVEGAGRGAMKGQMLETPVRIVRARVVQ